MEKKPEAKHTLDLLTTFCMSKAMLEDYARVISKIEGTSETDVLQRVRSRTKELLAEHKLAGNKAEQPIPLIDENHAKQLVSSAKPALTLFDDKPVNSNGSNVSSLKGNTLNLIDGDVTVYSNFFSKKESDVFFQRLMDEIKWQQDKIKFYGKEMDIPRLTAWYGETDKPYTYSGIPMHPHPWSPLLMELKERIESVSPVKFSSVLLNLYRNGKDSVSWHSDDEKELGQNPVIGSISFGAARPFQLKHKKHKDLKKVDIMLEHGTFLLMKGPTQHFWQHQIPKTSKPLPPRINLTFRVIS